MPRRGRRSLLVMLSIAALLLAAAPASADKYDSQNAGHPLRLVAYVLYPVGVLLDTLIARPAHWFVSLGPMRKVFGHEENYEETESQEYPPGKAETPPAD